MKGQTRFTSVFKTIRIIYNESKTSLISAIILLLTISSLPLVQLVTIETLINHISEPTIEFKKVVCILIANGVLAWLNSTRTLVNLLGSYLWITAEISLQNKTITRVGRKNLLFFDTPKEFEKLEKANKGYGYAVGNSMMFISTVFITVASLLSMTTYLINVNGMIVLTLLLIAPIKLFAAKKTIGNIQRMRDIQTQDVMKEQKLRTYIFCRDSGLHRAKQYFLKKWYSLFVDLSNQSTKAQQQNLLFSFSTDCICFLIYGFVLVFGVINATSTSEAMGDAVLLLVAMESLFSGINSMVEQANNLMMNSMLSDDLFNFMNDNNNEHNLKHIKRGKTIELKNVFFCYPTSKKIILNDINLKIQLGENIAIVGENGAGKSTLIKILMGMYLPTRGEVYYGDEFNFDNLKYNNISMMQQEVKVYNLTLRDNIKISDMDLGKDEEADNILVNVLGKEKMNSLSNGAMTLVGKEFGGIDMSGGEKQRLSYGRALYRDYTLLVLDEPTAAIDAIHEEKIYKEFLELSQKSTTIFVTHRLASAKYADRIIVLKDGSIIESGTHKELVSYDGVYSRMYKLQKGNM